MITYSKLGLNGRLGNQLYQIASTVGYALKYNQEYGFNWDYSEYFNITNTPNIETHTRIIESNGLNYCELPKYENYMRNVDMHGYLQSHKYFDEYKKEIFSIFKVKDIIEDCGFIHVRRGDYLHLPNHHPIVPLQYYLNGMDILGKSKYYCFSDDIKWCIENIKDDRVVFVENTTEIEDLMLMMSCNAAIIANSSFSWWGAYLGDHNNVIAPRKWFGDAYSGFIIEDRIPERWLLC